VPWACLLGLTVTIALALRSPAVPLTPATVDGGRQARRSHQGS
jgi:hypothetical protein